MSTIEHPENTDYHGESDLEQRLNAARQWCDEYRQHHPDLYFFQYGSALYHQASVHSGTISQSDIDMRCVCVALPAESEQQYIAAHIAQLLFPIKLELYFTQLADYAAGKVGTTGEMTDARCMVEQLDPNRVTTSLRHSGLVAIFSYATMRRFSNQPMLPSHLMLADQQFSLPKPGAVLDALVLTREDAVEWVQMYLKFALADYYNFRRDGTDWADYARRLCKYVIRIAFGVFMAQLDPGELQKMKIAYAGRLPYNTQAFDGVHVQIIKTYAQRYGITWAGDALDLLSLALDNRLHQLHGYFTEARPYAPSAVPEEALHDFVHELESYLLFFALQTGVSDRRDEYPLADILLETTLENGVNNHLGLHSALLQPGSTLLSPRSESDTHFYFVPRRKLTSEPNGGLHVIKPESVVEPERSMFVGLLRALLPNAPRTVRVVAGDQPVEVYKLQGEWARKLLQDDRLRRIAHRARPGMVRELQQMLLLHSLATNITYGALYYIRDLAQQHDISADMTEDLSDLTTPQKEENPLQRYYLADFGQRLKTLCDMRAKQGNQLCEVYANTTQEPIELFPAFDTQTNKLYVVLDGTALVTFPGNPNSITLHKDSVFGEASLLRARTRSAGVRLLPGSSVLEIDAKRFEDLTSSFMYEKQLGCIPRDLLYHIGFVNMHRILTNLKDMDL